MSVQPRAASRSPNYIEVMGTASGRPMRRYFPALASRLFPFVLLPPFVAELSMASWLFVKGVNPTRWAERARPVPL